MTVSFVPGKVNSLDSTGAEQAARRIIGKTLLMDVRAF